MHGAQSVAPGHHMFSGMVLPDATAIFIQCDIQRPMQLMLAIPMLTNQGDEDRGGPHQTGQGEAVLTRDRGLLVRHPDGFYGNHRVEAWPLLQRREGREVRHPPDASAHAPSVGVGERLKAMGRIAPWEMVLELRMTVLGHCWGGRFVIVLERQEVVPALVQDVCSHGRLTAHRSNGDTATVDRQEWKECWYGRDRIGLLLCCDVSNAKSAVLRTPGGEHREWGQGSGTIKGRLHRLAIE